MKKVFLLAGTLLAAGLIYACMPHDQAPDSRPTAPLHTATASLRSDSPVAEGAIAWMTWDEAVKANEKTKKKFFIDFYTDWCGWCKKMDKTTFMDPAVVKYVNENFYAVKFNAEQKEDVLFQNTTFKWQAGGRGGVHMLAYELLDGRLGYPSYVYLTPAYERILISPGFKDAASLQKELVFVKEDKYNTTTWEDFKKTN